MSAKPIVVGVDGSDESLRAVEWAAREAVRHEAPLRIVAVPASPPRARSSLLSQRSVGNAVRGMAARALAEGIARSEEVAPGLSIDASLLELGIPAVTVTGAGADASMLVVGARGTGGFSAMLLGSVSRYAASYGPCPVVVVRERTMAVHRSVIVGVREPGSGADTVAFAFEEAARRSAELVVVHVVHPRPGDDGRQTLTAAEDDLAKALGPWREEHPDVCVRQDVVQGHPAQVLSRYCTRADLVILGRHDAPEAAHSIGSTWRAVLNHATAPVAVVPPGACRHEPDLPGQSRMVAALAEFVRA